MLSKLFFHCVLFVSYLSRTVTVFNYVNLVAKYFVRLKLLAQHVYKATRRRAGQRGLCRQPSPRHGGGPVDRRPRCHPDQQEPQDNVHIGCNPYAEWQLLQASEPLCYYSLFINPVDNLPQEMARTANKKLLFSPNYEVCLDHLEDLMRAVGEARSLED